MPQPPPVDYGGGLSSLFGQSPFTQEQNMKRTGAITDSFRSRLSKKLSELEESIVLEHSRLLMELAQIQPHNGTHKFSNSSADAEDAVDLTVTWMPGPIGIKLRDDTGFVEEVYEGGQAQAAGVKPGMSFNSIDDGNYSPNLLDTMISGSEAYRVRFVSTRQKDGTRAIDWGILQPLVNNLLGTAVVEPIRLDLTSESRYDESDSPTRLSCASEEEQLVRVSSAAAWSQDSASDNLVFRGKTSDKVERQRISVETGLSSHQAQFQPSAAAPQRAFVINVRRLIETHKVLNTLHELVKSTAIAAITLVAVGSSRQLLSTTIFILGTFCMFAMHENSWDSLDTNDLKSLLPLLSDDASDDPAQAKFGGNPNRLLKALSFSTSRVFAFIWGAAQAVMFAILLGSWLVMGRYWERGLDPEENLNEVDGYDNPLDWWVDSLITEQNDGDILGLQLMAASLMFGLHLFFEYVCFRENGAILPSFSADEVWDPREHGVPLRHRLFGLPSMWFTSRQAYDDLIRFIDMAHNCRVRNILPQELAILALSGDDQVRGELTKALATSKLFSARTRRFELERGRPRTLNIDLCFFDTQLHATDFPYPGEFHYFVEESDNASDEYARKICRITSHMATRKPARYMTSVFKRLGMVSNLGLGKSRSNVGDAGEQ